MTMKRAYLALVLGLVVAGLVFSSPLIGYVLLGLLATPIVVSVIRFEWWLSRFELPGSADRQKRDKARMLEDLMLVPTTKAERRRLLRAERRYVSDYAARFNPSSQAEANLLGSQARERLDLLRAAERGEPGAREELRTRNSLALWP